LVIPKQLIQAGMVLNGLQNKKDGFWLLFTTFEKSRETHTIIDY
jgi:hypothetical protein